MDEATIAAWAARIKAGLMSIEQVPAVYREEVQTKLDS